MSFLAFEHPQLPEELAFLLLPPPLFQPSFLQGPNRVLTHSISELDYLIPCRIPFLPFVSMLRPRVSALPHLRENYGQLKYQFSSPSFNPFLKTRRKALGISAC